MLFSAVGHPGGERFQGTIPGPMRAIVHETAVGWPRGLVYVPCCGNFTIERSLAGMGFGQ